MKNLKYVLFGLIISFFALNNVTASSMVCDYSANLLTKAMGNTSDYDYIRFRVTYSVNGSRYGSVTTEVGTDNTYTSVEYKEQASATLYIINKDGRTERWGEVLISNLFSDETMQSYYNNGSGNCPDIKLTVLDETYARYKAEPVAVGTASTNSAIVTSGKTTKYDSSGEETEVEDIKETKTCSITGGNEYIDLTMQFSMYSNGVQKVKICKTGTNYCAGNNNTGTDQSFVINTGSSQYRIAISAATMASFFTQTSTQQKDNTFTCKNSNNVYIISTDAWAHTITTDKEEAEDWSGTDFDGENMASNPPSGGSTTSDNNDNLDLENFCQGSVQGVFTTLGWVFFILKILIPIILIIFGSIDFAKAVISSKDDEIKKSAKTLATRAIAGVIIFFIPTLLSFIVSLIDKENVYNGTFTNCTQCMLNPKHEFKDGSVCSGLRGE